MTYVYYCHRKSCQPSVEKGKELNLHMRSNCCHKCPNPTCRDHGECNCLEEFHERFKEQMEEAMKSPEWLENVLPRILENIDVKDDQEEDSRADDVVGDGE